MSELLSLTSYEIPPAFDTRICTSLEVLTPNSFATVYADPPWEYDNSSTRAAANGHYGTMTLERLKALPVDKLAATDAHLHLWTTNAFLFDAKSLMEAWGFEYKSVFVWVKPQMGIGNYWRVSHEFLLFGIRGNCPFLSHEEMSWDLIDRTAHSSKPEKIRRAIERTSPGPYLEMFGRRPATGWTVFGNQIQKGMFDADVLEI